MDRDIDQINVIPPVDVMPVLLVIILTTATFIVTGPVPVDLAEALNPYPWERLIVLRADRAGVLRQGGGRDQESRLPLRQPGSQARRARLMTSLHKLRQQRHYPSAAPRLGPGVGAIPFDYRLQRRAGRNAPSHSAFSRSAGPPGGPGAGYTALPAWHFYCIEFERTNGRPSADPPLPRRRPSGRAQSPHWVIGAAGGARFSKETAMRNAAPRFQATGDPVFDDPDGTPPTAWVRAVQRAQGQSPCYRSDERFFCPDQDCPWRHPCRKLVAAWRR
ncbi:hypothetical protein ACWJKU_10655 [Methylocaldum sp. MU1018]